MTLKKLINDLNKIAKSIKDPDEWEVVTLGGKWEGLEIDGIQLVAEKKVVLF